MLYELKIGATDWANITSDTFSLRQPTDITRGVPGEYSQADPSTCSFWMNNRLGRYSPRNPASPFYQQIGRNTPVRVSLGNGAYGMVVSGANNSGGNATTSDKAALDITGDIDIRVDLELLANPVGADGYTTPSSWLTGNFDLASKFSDADPSRSWSLILINGKLRFYWFTAGTVASVQQAESITLTGSPTGRRAIRVTLDVVNGANKTVTFYTAPDINGTWTVLGSAITTAGNTSIFSGDASLRIGGAGNGSAYTWAEPPYATFYSAEVRNGIGGTVVASPNFTSQGLDPVPFSVSNFLDAQGNDWFFQGVNDASRIWYGDVDIRFWGECSAFPNRWDTSGKDAWVPIEAAGLFRRLGNGSEPAHTGLRDWIMDQNPVPTSYFPLSGAEGTKYSVNLGDIGTNSLRFYPEGAPVYTYGIDFGVPWLGTGMELNATGPTADMRGDVVTADDNFVLDFVFQSPAVTLDSGADANTNMGVLDIFIWSYDYDRWQLRLQDPANGGTLQLSWFAGDNSTSSSYPVSAALPALMDNEIHTCRFQVHTTGGGTTQTADVYIDGVLIDTRVVASGHAWNGTSNYQMFYSRYAGQTVMTLGHLTGWSDPVWSSAPAVTDFLIAARGYTGELAADRMARIAALSGINLTVIGNNSDTMPMGPQYSESKLTQLRDAEQADMGYLLEPRGGFGLEYRTRVSMVGQAPALTLDYSLGQIVPPFEPTDDDLLTKNDVTVGRREGDSARVQLTTGRLSILDPPMGVGQYHDSLDVNVETDALLPGIAAWMVNLGTVDQARYPSLSVDLGILAGFGLDQAARNIDTGDLLVVTGMDALGVYEDVRLLVLGTGRETISDGGFKHTITWNCAPYQGYEGAVFATSASTGSARYDTAGSTLTTGITSSATSFSITATGGTLWTTDPAAFPFDVMMSGERITLSAISGASSPQTATVSARSVNGVVKAQVAGADIRLADPSYYSL
jgi:hypothetical protein